MASTLQTAPVQYTKLPGRAGRMFKLFVNERQRLWLADDHILVVTQSVYYERYKRFYLADIQALSIQKTATGAVLNFVLIAFVALFGSLGITGYFNDWGTGAAVVLGGLAGAFVLATLINVAFGPTCQCDILTAVHEESLFCLSRLYTAERVVEYLRTAIEGVQGATTGAEHLAEQHVAHAMKAADARDQAGMIRQDSGALHAAAFSMLLVDAIVALLSVIVRNPVTMVLSVMSSVLLAAVILSALIRQRSSDIPRSLRSTAWTAFAVNAVLLLTRFYALGILQQARERGSAEQLAMATSIEAGVVLFSASAALVLNAIFGAAGFYYYRLWRGAARSQAPFAPEAAPETPEAGG